MPKFCPIGKKGSHACFECIFNECLQCMYWSKTNDVVERQVENTACLKCIHFNVCARHTGGMNLMLCEDYLENKEKYATKGLNLGLRSYCSNCGKLSYMHNYCATCGAKVKGS